MPRSNARRTRRVLHAGLRYHLVKDGMPLLSRWRKHRRRGSAHHERAHGESLVEILDETRDMFTLVSGELALRPLVEYLFTITPVPEIQALKDLGLDADSFYERELGPSWEGLDESGRRARLQAFMRIWLTLEEAADVDPDALDLWHVVRAKVLLLSWAFDQTHHEHYFGRLSAR